MYMSMRHEHMARRCASLGRARTSPSTSPLKSPVNNAPTLFLSLSHPLSGSYLRSRAMAPPLSLASERLLRAAAARAWLRGSAASFLRVCLSVVVVRRLKA